MLAHLVRALLAAEFLLYAGLGAWLHSRHGWSVPAIVAAALGAVLVSRLAVVIAATALSFLFRSPRGPDRQVALAGGLALVARETLAMLADNFWRLPYESLALRADPSPLRDGAVPVLMVHGYVSNRGLLAPLVLALEAAGATQVFTFNFHGIFHSIDAQVAQLDERVQATLAVTGQERVVLVCHSMGGLIARAWLAKHGARAVARVVTIASPHHGTMLAGVGLGANARQMQRRSEFLRALEASEGERGPMCPFTSIYSLHDTLVAPQDTSRLPWAKNVELFRWGHVGILAAEETHLLVAEELRQAGALAPR